MFEKYVASPSSRSTDVDASHIQKENRESPSQTTSDNSGVLERVFSNKPKARTFHRLVVNSP